MASPSTAPTAASGPTSLVAAEQTFVVIEVVRRIGVSLHLVATAFGLATIIEVLRFQAVRIGELAATPRSATD